MEKKVFVTYSWDSKEHQKWVMMMTNTLREKDGIDATLDVYEIEGQTKNLNRMMIDNIHGYDYIVVVMTEEYAKKANNEIGGVGYESTALMDIIKNPQERNKVIFLNRYNGNYNSTIPNFARGYSFIDVSDSNLEDGYEKLVRRIKEAPKYVKPGLGNSRELTSEEVGTFSFGGIKIPDLKPITNNDKESFIKKNFDEMLKIFEETFSAIKKQNPNFLYSIEDKGEYFNISISLEKEKIKKMNFWIGNFGNFSNEKNSIFYQYTQDRCSIIEFNKNSYNGMISVEVNQNGELELKNSFGFSIIGQTIEEISKNILENEFIKPLKDHHSRNLICR